MRVAIALLSIGFAAFCAAAEPTVYIVSLEDTPAATKGATSAAIASIDQKHAAFLDRAKAATGRTLVPRFRYRVVGNGMALELTPDEAAQLAKLPGVRAVRPDRAQRLLTDASPAFIGADQLWNGAVAGVPGTKGAGTVVGVIDSGLNFAHPSFAATGADGYTATNPRGRFFGQCLDTPSRCSGKLIGIYDYTPDGARDGADGTGHGSHVASTAAGNVVNSSIAGHTITVPLSLSGVAPHASLVVYKACRSTNNCFDSETLAALDQAAIDRVEVVNYSIGSLPEDPWTGIRSGANDTANAMLNLRAVGVVPVVAAGNDGPDPATAGYPGNAPWVIDVAAASQQRRFATALADLSGPGIASTSFFGDAISGGLATARVVDAADFGFPLCGTGTAAGVGAPGSDNPFPAGTFHGEIVVCRRGVYARVNKGFNVRQAGAGGMVLANSAAEAESVVADDHYLPAVHIGFADAQRLYGLLAQVRQAGGNATASITATQRRFESRGDVLAGFSSRGPVDPFGGWLKPNITAPGVNIIAAAQTGGGLATMSGTSMAAPQVAGAAALLRAAHPGWSVAQVESALLTHGIDDVLKENAVTRAAPYEGGVGRAWVPDAVRSALTFNVTPTEFRNADPNGSAVLDPNPPPLPNPVVRGPSALNLPYLVSAHCIDRCTLSRTATDNGGGSAWRAELHLPAGALGTVSPSTFQLASGASQKFSVSLDVSNVALTGSWVNGDLTLVNTSGNAPDVRLPVSVFADAGTLPAEIRIAAPADGGFTDLALSGLTVLSNPRYAGGGLVPIASDVRTITEDLNPSELFTLPRNGAYFDTVPMPNELDAQGLPASTSLEVTIYAEGSSPTARNIDLYVGIDTNGNGKPDADETICERQGGAATETCLLHRSVGNQVARPLVWFLVQNFDGVQSTGDVVRLRYAVTALDSGRNDTKKSYARYGLLRATGPGKAATGDTIPVRLAWTAPGMLPGDAWLSMYAMSATPGGAVFGNVPVFLDVAAGAPHLPVLMSGLDDTIAVRLLAHGIHDRIAIDVPPNAGSLTVDMTGTAEGDLYLAPSLGEPPAPAIGFAPPGSYAVGVSEQPGTNESVTISGMQLTPGRWYIVPTNAGNFVVDATIRVRLAFTGAAAATPDSAWFDPDRSGHGMFLNFGGDQWVAFWYAYLQDGSPAWYLAQAQAPGPADGVWSAPLTRFTWNGSANFGTTVGRLSLVRSGSAQLRFNWMLDGTYGSEPMVALTAPGGNCASPGGTPTDFSGAWYAPARSGYGYSVITNASTETEVAYLYDAAGNPRWLYGQNSPFGSGVFDLTQYRGFCPLCAYSAIQGTSVGGLARTFANARAGTAQVDAGFVAPASGAWNVSDTTAKLTRDIPCL